jgi:hypothetical protein
MIVYKILIATMSDEFDAGKSYASILFPRPNIVEKHVSNLLWMRLALPQLKIRTIALLIVMSLIERKTAAAKLAASEASKTLRMVLETDQPREPQTSKFVNMF